MTIWRASWKLRDVWLFGAESRLFTVDVSWPARILSIVGEGWSGMSGRLTLQYFYLRIRLDRLMNCGDKGIEAVHLGIDVFHLPERPLRELRKYVEKLASFVTIGLKLEVALRNQLFNLCHHRGKSLADILDDFFLQELAQEALGEMYFDLQLASVRMILL